MGEQRIKVKYIESSKQITSIKGRFTCIKLQANGYFRILKADTLQWIEFKLVNPHTDYKKLENIALRDKGSLFVSLPDITNQLGYIINIPLKKT